MKLHRRLPPPWIAAETTRSATPKPGQPWGKAPNISLPS